MASFADKHGGYCICTRERCTDDCEIYRHNDVSGWHERMKRTDLHGTDEGGGIRYDERGNVIDYGIVGPPGEPGVKKEATDGT